MVSITDFMMKNSPETNKKQRDEIDKIFGVSRDDVFMASSAADAGFYNDNMTYFFFAECVKQARDIIQDVEEDGMMDVLEEVDLAAESVIPFQTFVIYSIWVDLGYEVEFAEDMGYSSVELDDIYKVAQTQLYGYARIAIQAVIGKELDGIGF
jgi:hypothetical protein